MTESTAALQSVVLYTKACQYADLVIVGTVTEFRSYHDPAALNAVVTDVVLEVEATAHGPAVDEVQVKVLGGQIGQQMAISPGFPWIEEGARFLLVLREIGVEGEVRYNIAHWDALTPGGFLPWDRRLNAVWRERCAAKAAAG